MSDKRSQREQRYRQRLEKIEQERQAQKANAKAARRPKDNIGNKIPNLKKQRQWQSTWRAGIVLGIFGILICISLYIILPISKINQINVTGNQELTKQAVISASTLRNKLTLSALLNEKKYTPIAKQKNAKVSKLNIKVTGMRSVNVQVTENRTAGYLEKNNRYYAMLESGYVEKNSHANPIGGRPIYLDFKSTKIAQKTVTQYAKLSDSIKTAVSEIQYAPTKTDPQRIKIYMSDGNLVMVKYGQLSEKMNYYPEIAKNMSANGVVNLELGAYSYAYTDKDK